MQILVIDDEPAIRQVFASALNRAGHDVEQASCVAEANARLARGDVDVAICDIKMPDGNGIDVVRASRENGIETAFLVVTAFASVENAVEALRAGASDYITKPVRTEEMLHRITQIGAMRGLRDENRLLRRVVSEREKSSKLFQFSAASMRLHDRLLGKVAPTESTVLLTGESGTGKSVSARLIHEISPRRDGIFLPVNCGAIPENLLEAELFGHTKGAFTGADRARKGLFAEADKGTIFLDEIGELPLHMQTKLLHVIEEKTARAVGSDSARRVDTRVIAATNRVLPEMVREGRFREDLFFRLSMFEIRVPPLRERAADLPALIRFILEGVAHYASAANRVTEIDPAAEEVLLAYPWPGNIRELENVLNRACILAEGQRISLADLPADLRRDVGEHGGAGTRLASNGCLRDQLRAFESMVVHRTLEETDNDRRAAAQRLGIGLSSLYRKLDEFEKLGLLEAGQSARDDG